MAGWAVRNWTARAATIKIRPCAIEAPQTAMSRKTAQRLLVCSRSQNARAAVMVATNVWTVMRPRCSKRPEGR